MKAPLFAVLAGSLLASSPALAAHGGRNADPVIDSRICQFIPPNSGDRLGQLEAFWAGYVAYAAAGGALTWLQFKGYAQANC